MSPADHRVALFDLDGTLVDSVPLIIASYQHALTTVLGRPGDEAVVRSWIGRPLIDAFVEVSPERAQELFDCYSAWNLAHTAESLRAFPVSPSCSPTWSRTACASAWRPRSAGPAPTSPCGSAGSTAW